MNLEFYRMRIDSIRYAASRSRWVHAAATVGSLALLGAAWNVYASQLRDFAMKPGFSSNPVTELVQRELLERWVDSGFVSVPFLGIQMSVADASIVGAAGLYILSLWLFYSLRRENHLIGATLRSASGEQASLRAFVYHGICGTQLFATVRDNDEPIATLEDTPASYRVVLGVRGAAKLLLYMPGVAILAVLAFDLLSIIAIPAAFRDDHPVLGALPQSWRFWLYWVPGLVIAFATWILLLRAEEFQQGTVAMLREAHRKSWDQAVEVDLPGEAAG